MRGKLIVIEGTDCSGKQTQTDKLYTSLNASKVPVAKLSFPMYNTPTGKIIGGPYLGKEEMGRAFFKEGAVNVDPKVASLYYAADRKYNVAMINDLLETGVNVILDRYVYSNMAHQAGKILDMNERIDMYNWLDMLEFKLLELPQPDIAVFLHMPYEAAKKLRENRIEKPDQHEMDKEHLVQAENAYIELASRYKWDVVSCAIDNDIKSVAEIALELYNCVSNKLK